MSNKHLTLSNIFALVNKAKRLNEASGYTAHERRRVRQSWTVEPNWRPTEKQALARTKALNASAKADSLLVTLNLRDDFGRKVVDCYNLGTMSRLRLQDQVGKIPR